VLDWLPSVAWVTVVIAYGVLANAWNRRDPGWYDSLPRPSFQPPDVVFAVIWPLNFLALLVAGVWFTRSEDPGRAWAAVGVLALSVGAALLWAWLFYVPHRLVGAAASLTVAIVLTWSLVALVAASVPWAAVVLVPYAGWLAVATALSVQYARTA
jgi:tryptophan-rich sensory protein